MRLISESRPGGGFLRKAARATGRAVRNVALSPIALRNKLKSWDSRAADWLGSFGTRHSGEDISYGGYRMKGVEAGESGELVQKLDQWDREGYTINGSVILGATNASTRAERRAAFSIIMRNGRVTNLNDPVAKTTWSSIANALAKSDFL